MSIIPLEREYLIHLLCAVLHQTPPHNPSPALEWEKLYRLSLYHNVSNMVFYAISKLSDDSKPPQDVMAKFQNDCRRNMAREATQHITVEQILKTFEEKHIDCMPLKGYLIKYLYPQPDMRMMSDVDILFKNEQTNQVEKLMTGMGFSLENQGGNHDVYYKKPFMNIEMHRRLMSENSPYSSYFQQVWDRVRLKPGYQFTYELSHEDFYIYILTHLTKHYVNGGTGIRSIMDIWVYNNRYIDEMDWNYIRNELEKIQLREFADNICGLSEVWFGNASTNELYDEIAGYIFSSGVYGTKKHAVIASVNTNNDSHRSIETAKAIYLLNLFFPGLDHMKILYPFLDKLPFLMPFCWILRGLKSVFFKRRNTFEMIGNVQSVSKEEAGRLQNLHERAGL